MNSMNNSVLNHVHVQDSMAWGISWVPTGNLVRKLTLNNITMKNVNGAVSIASSYVYYRNTPD